MFDQTYVQTQRRDAFVAAYLHAVQGHPLDDVRAEDYGAPETHRAGLSGFMFGQRLTGAPGVADENAVRAAYAAYVLWLATTARHHWGQRLETAPAGRHGVDELDRLLAARSDGHGVHETDGVRQAA